jgi:hypothetical protein
MHRRSVCMLTSLVALVLFSAVSPAAVIQFKGASEFHGTGFGAVPTLLVLQNSPTQWGAVLPAGAMSTGLRSGHEKPFSTTPTAGELLKQGIGSQGLGVVLNLNQPGTSRREEVRLRGFTLRFFTDRNGLDEFFDAAYVAPDGGLVLAPISSQGTGTAGWLFSIDLPADDADRFFSDPSNRVGMFIPQDLAMQDSFGGPDSFHLIPEPGALLGLAAVGWLGLRRPRHPA